MGSKTHADAVGIASENDAVSNDSQGRYIATGLLVVDYGTDHSFNKEDRDGGASTRAFNAMAKASRYGGIGTLRGQESELIAVGRYGTDGIRLLDSAGNRDINAKGLQFEEYAVLGPGDDRYERVTDISGTMGSAVRYLSDEEKSALRNLIDELEAEGRLRRPIR